MSENILYTYLYGNAKYYPASVVKCNICNEMFQVKKGFFLKDDIISCYKHDIKNGEIPSPS